MACLNEKSGIRCQNLNMKSWYCLGKLESSYIETAEINAEFCG